MKASETVLQPVIEGTKQYVVPLFQRTYSWNAREWKILWQDISDLCSEANPRTHFIGSIVTIPALSVPEGVTKFLLIDGQQRLTTVFVILSAIRNLARELRTGTLADQIDDLLLKNKYQEGNDIFKLLPTQGDREDFLRLMSGATPVGKGRIKEAFDYFSKEVRANGDPELLRKIVVGHLSLVSIVLDKNENPHLIFESLNAKGQPLSQSDLIRNYFFMRMHVNLQEEMYLKYWEPMQNLLDGQLTEFIRHYLIAKTGNPVKQADIYFLVKEDLDQQPGSDAAIEYLKSMRRGADHYAKLLAPRKEPDPQLSERLQYLNRIEVSTAYPFLLRLYEEYEHGTLSVTSFCEILDIVENFITRRFVCGVATNTLTRTFAPLYAQAKQADSFIGGIREYLRTKNYPKDEEFKDRLVIAKLYAGGDRAAKTKVLLERLEASLGNKEQVSYDDVNIEHVMPQKLSDEWCTALGPNHETNHELWLHTLGNLTLTGYNPELSNQQFAKKKVIFVESRLQLNRYFDKMTAWTFDSIKERGEYLANKAVAVWKYFGPSETDSDAAKLSVTGTTPVAIYILGERRSVASWRDVAQTTLEVIADLSEEAFAQLLVEFPRLLGRDKSKLRSPRELSNGVFMEANLSAEAVRRFCIQATSVVGLSTDDWRVIFDK